VLVGLVASAPADAQSLVALGDSFSSGQGAPPYEKGTTGHGNTCYRSDRAWPMLVARQLRLHGESVACNGAQVPEVVTTDRRRDERERRTSQTSRIPRGAALVTITIGGNDVGFASVLRHCVTDRHPCDTRYRTDAGDELEDEIHRLEGELPTVYDAIERAAPSARVIVVGYPRIFPRTVPRHRVENCAVRKRISQREARYLNARTRSLNAAIGRAAAVAGVEYVNVTGEFEGHELRCEGESFVHRPHFRAGWPPYRPDAFHPNLAGYQRLADVVADYLGR
jgi:lysophospholipase L1-like esterase